MSPTTNPTDRVSPRRRLWARKSGSYSSWADGLEDPGAHLVADVGCSDSTRETGRDRYIRQLGDLPHADPATAIHAVPPPNRVPERLSRGPYHTRPPVGDLRNLRAAGLTRASRGATMLATLTPLQTKPETCSLDVPELRRADHPHPDARTGARHE